MNRERSVLKPTNCRVKKNKIQISSFLEQTKKKNANLNLVNLALLSLLLLLS